MKKNLILGLIFVALVAPWIPQPAAALSCLPTDMYLKDVVGKEEIVIFVGNAVSRSEEKESTTERLAVTKALQGYVEKEIFVYHQKHPDWGYLCNAGPSDTKNAIGVYITERDAYGKYNVYQRLEVDSDFAKNLEADLVKKEITGETVELTATDRANQIMTTIEEMIGHIMTLLKEYAYYLSVK